MRATTPRMARYLLSGLLILLLSTGCQHLRPQSQTYSTSSLPASDAPAFGLAVEDKPVISTVSHRLEPDIEIVDSRDHVEKSYYPGESSPERYRDAVSVLPMESFNPGFDRHLRRSVVRAMSDPLLYSDVQLEIKSFFVTLDAREQTHEKLLYAFKQWNDTADKRDQQREEQKRLNEMAEEEAIDFRRSLGMPDTQNQDDNGLGAKIGRLLFDRGVVAPIRKSLRNREARNRLKAAPQTIPVLFTENRSDGWNCHIDLEVTVVDAEGTTRSIAVTHDTRAEHITDASTTEQGKEIVIQALSEVSLELRSKGL